MAFVYQKINATFETIALISSDNTSFLVFRRYIMVGIHELPSILTTNYKTNISIMKKNVLLLSFICCLFICCTKINGPFEGINFGHVSKKAFLNEMINNGKFQVYKEDKKKINDTTSIGFILKKDDQEFSMRVHFNEEFYKGDRFSFGNLRKMEFRIGEHTTDEFGHFYRNSGKVSKEFLENLYEAYIEMYGQPDSIKVLNEYTYPKSSSNDPFEKYRKGNDIKKIIDEHYFPGKKATWFKKNFILNFNIPTLKKPKIQNEKIYYQKDYDNSIIISYEMKDYTQELIRLKDSISKNFNPNDIIEFNIVSSGFINSNQFLVKLSSVSLKDLDKSDFLTDKIKGFNYNLIIIDENNTLIFRKDNLEYQFELTLGDNGKGVISMDETYPYYKELLFDINNKVYQNQKSNFKVIMEVTKLKLENGRVINGK